MLEYIIKRLLLIPITLLGIYTITFALLYIVPGDPVATIVGQHADEQTKNEIRKDLELDKPWYIQYKNRLWRTLHGDLGRSFIRQEEVSKAIISRVPNTALLAFVSVLISFIVGVPIGVISAIKQYTWIDRGVMALAITGVSTPSFLAGLLALLFFTGPGSLRIFPIQVPTTYPEMLWYVILPASVLGLREVAIIARLTRSSMLEVIRQDYIQVARAKGISEFKVIMKHALRNVLIPVVTYVGTDFAFLMGGAVVSETVFTWPGIGLLSVQSLRDLDIPMVLGTVLFIATAIVFINLLVDISYAILDPRIKLGSKNT